MTNSNENIKDVRYDVREVILTYENSYSNRFRLLEFEKNDFSSLVKKFKLQKEKYPDYILGKEAKIETLFNNFYQELCRLMPLWVDVTLTTTSLFYTINLKPKTHVHLEVFYEEPVNGIECIYSVYENNELIISNDGLISSAVNELNDLLSEKSFGDIVSDPYYITLNNSIQEGEAFYEQNNHFSESILKEAF